ncbi:LacI family DNA-binding transcriptional regulator [Leifsonia sp. NPDC058194]|uniref:LacI family DNA-binding transcriptional regulator n=1 Tax=Leifsonia sp. NPDC058194 TaxID=3346374 RepID=UPI0036DDF64E
MKDVAQAAKVSTATVSRVVSDNGYPVAEETRLRVLETVRRMGYTPNDLARSLLKDATRTIGIIVPDLANPHHPGVLRGVEDVAVANGYSVLFSSIDGHPDRLENYLNVMATKRIDGLIMAGGGYDSTPPLEQIRALRLKTVMAGPQAGGQLPGVEIDNVAAGRLAAEHLVQLGHRSIGVITGPQGTAAPAGRLAGARQVFAEAGLNPGEMPVVESPFASEGGYAGGRALLDRDDRPTAIIAASDVIAVGAMAAAHDLGLRVPQDLAIVGYDDIPVSRFLRPSLTTIGLPSWQIGATAMEVLLKLLRGEEVPDHTVLGLELVVRGSTVAGADEPEAAPQESQE